MAPKLLGELGVSVGGGRQIVSNSKSPSRLLADLYFRNFPFLTKMNSWGCQKGFWGRRRLREVTRRNAEGPVVPSTPQIDG